MTYKLEFLPSALKEWHNLDNSIKQQFKKKLEERLSHPEIPSCRLSGWAHHYKIKLRTAGYRLVYEVVLSKKILQVIAIGKREKNLVYHFAHQRSS
jgi:mRNA interferase RelE/StbE